MKKKIIRATELFHLALATVLAFIVGMLAILSVNVVRTNTVIQKIPFLLLPEAATSTSDFAPYVSTPRITEYAVGSSTYTVIHWKPNEDDFSSALSLFRRTKNEYGRYEEATQLYSELAGSCEQPFYYGMEGAYFSLTRVSTPCEAFLEKWTTLYDAKGEAAIKYHQMLGVRTEFQFQVGNAEPQDVELVVNKNCSSIPLPKNDNEQPTPHVDVRGVRIGARTVLFPEPLDEACWVDEFADSTTYSGPDYLVTTSGTHVTVTVGQKNTVQFDVRAPEKATVEQSK